MPTDTRSEVSIFIALLRFSFYLLLYIIILELFLKVHIGIGGHTKLEGLVFTVHRSLSVNMLPSRCLSVTRRECTSTRLSN